MSHRSILKIFSTMALGVFVWAFMANPQSCAYTTNQSIAPTPQSGTPLKVDAYCSFFDAVKEEVTLASIPADFSSLTNVQVKLQQLAAYFDKPVSFQIGLTDMNTAAAVNSNAKNYILYNEKFYYELMSKAGTEWGPLSVFAHEIAHHLESHLLPKQYSATGHDHQKQQGQMLIQELEADWFSGRILAKMGATQIEATEAVRKVIPAHATATHPARAARLAIIENGWESVCANTSSCSSKAATETDLLAVDQFKHDLSSMNPQYTCRFKGQQLLIDDEDRIFWMKLPSHPVGARLVSTASMSNNCRYELTLLDKKYCVSRTKGRIIEATHKPDEIKRIEARKYYSNLCAPCKNGLCP